MVLFQYGLHASDRSPGVHVMFWSASRTLYNYYEVYKEHTSPAYMPEAISCVSDRCAGVVKHYQEHSTAHLARPATEQIIIIMHMHEVMYVFKYS